MDHVAILDSKKPWLNNILTRSKTIESRWSAHRRSPFGRVHVGDTVYFKNSGKPVCASATVDRVEYFTDLGKEQILKIITAYGDRIGITRSDYHRLLTKRYCTLVFLKDVRKIEPFFIDKTGFGNQAAWICVDSIEKIKVL